MVDPELLDAEVDEFIPSLHLSALRAREGILRVDAKITALSIFVCRAGFAQHADWLSACR
jgi:hypothetical protein